MKPLGWLFTIAPLLAVAGCSGEKTANDKREAGGEVLEGSISDAMLPVDTVRSQPPLAPHSAAAKEQGKDTSAEKPSPAPDAPAPAPAEAVDPPAPKPDAT